MTHSTVEKIRLGGGWANSVWADVDCWIFDLDNTLYPPECRLFDQIDRRMTNFIEQALGVSTVEANELRATYWREYGTTLNGLMTKHGFTPTAFLEHVHDIDLSGVAPNPELGVEIAALPGRKLVHTNGSRGHAARVLARLGVRDAFDGVFAIEDTDFTPKPQRLAFERVVEIANVAASSAAMFEDDARNLVEPSAMGMRAIWADSAGRSDAPPEHVHHVTADLTRFLRDLNMARIAG